jgi:hypothetical protein
MPDETERNCTKVGGRIASERHKGLVLGGGDCWVPLQVGWCNGSRRRG